MKASELIIKLQEMIELHGDLEVTDEDADVICGVEKFEGAFVPYIELAVDMDHNMFNPFIYGDKEDE